jgi:hypothetical protein
MSVMTRRNTRDRVEWPFNVTVLSGRVGPGPVDLAHRREIAPGRHAPMGEFVFDRVQAHGAVVVLDDLFLDIAWSELDECVFRQSRKTGSDGSQPQGNLGFRRTVYRRCEFDGVRFRTRAGFSVGQSRFEACIFRRCRFEEHFSFCADYIDCVFEGPIRTAVFYGRAPDGNFCDGKVNEIRGNDFRAATFSDNVAWRLGVALDSQQWPDGYVPAVDMT